MLCDNSNFASTSQSGERILDDGISMRRSLFISASMRQNVLICVSSTTIYISEFHKFVAEITM